MNFQEEAYNFSHRALELYRKLITDLAPFYRKESGFNEFNQIVLTELFIQLYCTGEKILMLTGSGDVWESDILIRTLSEGTVKYIYMMQEDLNQKSDLIDEYYNIIPEMQRIGDHGKAIEAIEAFKLVGVERHPFQLSIVSDEELEELKNKYSKNKISNLNIRWTYKNILKSLMEKEEKYKVLGSTFYSYSFSSHFIHYDGESLKQRAGALRLNVVENDKTLDKAHMLRIVSNVVSLGALRAGEYICKYNLNDSKHIQNINDTFLFLSEIEELSNNLTEGKF